MKGKNKRKVQLVYKRDKEKEIEKLRQKDRQKIYIMQEPFVVWLTVVRMMSGFEKGMTDRKKKFARKLFFKPKNNI